VLDDRSGRHFLHAGRLALHALARKRNRALIRALGNAYAFDTHRETRQVHHDEHVFEPAILLSDQISDGASLVTIGQDRPYVAAMVNIDMENVGKWAERRQVAYTTYTDLAQKPEVYALIAREVERVNRDLDEAMQIKRYVLLHKELDADDEEMTRTRKVRRGFVAKKYDTIIAALYTDATEVPVTSVITYQDGRQATIETKLAIRNVTEVLVSV